LIEDRRTRLARIILELAGNGEHDLIDLKYMAIEIMRHKERPALCCHAAGERGVVGLIGHAPGSGRHPLPDIGTLARGEAARDKIAVICLSLLQDSGLGLVSTFRAFLNLYPCSLKYWDIVLLETPSP
jgi:hypothetical protein